MPHYIELDLGKLSDPKQMGIFNVAGCFSWEKYCDVLWECGRDGSHEVHFQLVGKEGSEF